MARKSASGRPGPAAAPETGVPLKVRPVRPATPRGERLPYWCGTLPGAPFAHVAAGGVSFEGDRWEGSGAGKSLSRGAVHRLADAQVEFARKKVAEKVVRSISAPEGAAPRAVILDSSDPRYLPENGDVPLGAWLYMIELSPGREHLRPTDPEPMWSEGDPVEDPPPAEPANGAPAEDDGPDSPEG